MKPFSVRNIMMDVGYRNYNITEIINVADHYYCINCGARSSLPINALLAAAIRAELNSIDDVLYTLAKMHSPHKLCDALTNHRYSLIISVLLEYNFDFELMTPELKQILNCFLTQQIKILRKHDINVQEYIAQACSKMTSEKTKIPFIRRRTKGR